MMTITAYLFDYTLKVVFSGNRSECARKLKIRRTDFNRTEKRLHAGAASVRTAEAILRLFCEMDISVDQALAGYHMAPRTLPDEPVLQYQKEKIRLFRDSLSYTWVVAGNRMRIFKSAEAFLAELEHDICNESCEKIRNCQTGCPCKRFVEYMERLRDELDSPQREYVQPK